MNISLILQYTEISKTQFNKLYCDEWNFPLFFLSRFFVNSCIFNDFSAISLNYLNLFQIVNSSEQCSFELKRFLIRKELNFTQKESSFYLFSNFKYKNFSFWYNYKWLSEKENFKLVCSPYQIFYNFFLSDSKNFHFQNFYYGVFYTRYFLIWEKLVFSEILSINDLIGNSTWNLKIKIIMKSKTISSCCLEILVNKNIHFFFPTFFTLLGGLVKNVKIKNGVFLLGFGIFKSEITKKTYF